MNPLNLLLEKISLKSKGALVKQNRIGGDALACIAMILSHHNKFISLAELENRYPPFKNGMSLKHIMDVFKEFGLTTNALQCPTADLDQLKLPAILHWDMKQFVVLSSIKDSMYTVLDPATKKLIIDKDTLERHFAEIVLAIVG